MSETVGGGFFLTHTVVVLVNTAFLREALSTCYVSNTALCSVSTCILLVLYFSSWTVNNQC